MNRDLEETLNEMGPAYRAVVTRLRGAETAEADLRRKTSDQKPRRPASKVSRLRSYLTAASLLVLLGLGAVFFGRQDVRPQTQDARCAPSEYRATVSEMIATQNPDGSWQNDFLTRRNAAALRNCGDPAAQVAYKRAMRNLRVRGVL